MMTSQYITKAIEIIPLFITTRQFKLITSNVSMAQPAETAYQILNQQLLRLSMQKLIKIKN